MALREFAGAAADTTLASPINALAMSFTVATDGGDNYPDGATAEFVVALDVGSASEEKILCSARTGDVFTVATGGRGYDGTVAQSHSANATVAHVLDSATIREANQHANNVPADPHDQYLDTTRHDVTARHTVGTVVPAGVPGAVRPGDTASAGVATTVARSDHEHEVPAGTPGAVRPGDTASAGAADTWARSDHEHEVPVGMPVAVGATNAEGTADTWARSDHVHANPVILHSASLDNGDLGGVSVTWTNYVPNSGSASTSVTDPDAAVEIIAFIVAAILNPSTGTVMEMQMRCAISIDGGSTFTTGNEPTVQVTVQVGVVPGRTMMAAVHSRTGTPTGDIVVKPQFRLAAGSPGASDIIGAPQVTIMAVPA